MLKYIVRLPPNLQKSTMLCHLQVVKMKQAAMAAAAEYTWSNAALQYEAIFKEIGVKDVLNGTSVGWWSNKAVKTVIFQRFLLGVLPQKVSRWPFFSSALAYAPITWSNELKVTIFQVVASKMSSCYPYLGRWSNFTHMFWLGGINTTYLKVEGTSQALIPTELIRP